MSRYAVATDWITMSSRFNVLLAIGYLLAGWPNLGGAQSTATEDITNSLGMKLVYVPPGTFTMGPPANESGRESQETLHEVELTRGFYLGAHEVTVGQFRQFVIDAKFQTAAQRDGKGADGIDDSGKIDKMDAKLIWDNPKVQRGGGCSSDFKRLRSAARVGRDPVTYRGCYLGFRVALTPPGRDESSANSNP
jgi:formylglycine-generating enzyme required for sulfatase activity